MNIFYFLISLHFLTARLCPFIFFDDIASFVFLPTFLIELNWIKFDIRDYSRLDFLSLHHRAEKLLPTQILSLIFKQFLASQNPKGEWEDEKAKTFIFVEGKLMDSLLYYSYRKLEWMDLHRWIN